MLCIIKHNQIDRIYSTNQPKALAYLVPPFDLKMFLYCLKSWMTLFILTIYVTTNCGTGSLIVSSDLCREPSNVANMYRNLKTTGINNVPGLRDSSPEDGPNLLDNTEFRQVRIVGLNRTCHASRFARSCHCRTRDEINFDVNRKPSLLMQTSCCHDNQRDTAHWITTCREMYHDIQVLRRVDCVSGVYEYALQWERIPVGCSCHVIPKVFPAQ